MELFCSIIIITDSLPNCITGDVIMQDEKQIEVPAVNPEMEQLRQQVEELKQTIASKDAAIADLRNNFDLLKAEVSTRVHPAVVPPTTPAKSFDELSDDELPTW